MNLRRKPLPSRDLPTSFLRVSAMLLAIKLVEEDPSGMSMEADGRASQPLSTCHWLRTSHMTSG
ncbi:rCG21800 [Rattus norvegicus]|uniref:RCG21800 n=1 Tax=Rattus norvegicus TaxID=10116 RepID=A6J0V0_RAT|nr:rCG21800 [Rattus norvegicus]